MNAATAAEFTSVKRKPFRLIQLWGIFVAISLYIGFAVAAWFFHDKPWNLEEDGVNFLIGAKTVFTEHYSPTWSPGSSFLMWLLSQLTLDLFQAGKLLVGLMGLLFLLATFFMLEHVLNREFANWGVLLVASTYTFLSNSVLLGSHISAAALALSGFFLFLDRSTFVKIFLSGLLLGMAVTFRINYLSLLGLVVVLLIGTIPRREKLTQTAIWCTAFLLGTGPLFLVNRFDTGQWRLASSLMFGSESALRFDSFANFLLSDPLAIAIKWLFRFAIDLPKYVISAFGWVGILGISGLVLGFTIPQKIIGVQSRKHWSEIGFAAVLFAVPLAFVFFDSAYLLFAIPILVAGTIYLFMIFTSVRENWRIEVAICVVLVLGVADTARNLRYYYTQATNTPDYASAGRFVNTLPPQKVILLAGQDHLRYYAGRPILDCRNHSSVDGVRVDYVVIDSRFNELADSCVRQYGIQQLTQEVFRTNSEPLISVYSVLQ